MIMQGSMKYGTPHMIWNVHVFSMRDFVLFLDFLGFLDFFFHFLFIYNIFIYKITIRLYILAKASNFF